MGPDGHTASLFPDHGDLSANQRLITFIKDSPKAPSERVTLTLKSINDTKHKIVVATGKSKCDIVQQVIEQKSRTYPIGQVEDLHWYLDKAAASTLSTV